MPQKNSPAAGKIAGIVIGAIVGAALVVGGVFLYVKWRRSRHGDKSPRTVNSGNALPLNIKTTDVEMNGRPASVELDSIPIVKNVKIKERLGGGNFGDVYRGEWKGAQVALKKLRSEQDYDEFAKECLVLL
jgi:hypothetical protein